MWKPEYPAPQNVDIFIAGDLIESVSAVAKGGFVQTDTVMLKEAVAGQYRRGDRVLVAGYIQQTTEDGTQGWGWPPNFRYFEWKTVREVVDAGTLRFEDPFRYSYDAAWPDLPDGSAAGSMARRGSGGCRLDDGRQPNRSLTIRNANFIGGRSRAPGSETPIAGTGWHVLFEGCTADRRHRVLADRRQAQRLHRLPARLPGGRDGQDRGKRAVRAVRYPGLARQRGRGRARCELPRLQPLRLRAGDATLLAA